MKQHGQGSSTQRVYIVEARNNYPVPKEHCGMILDKEWRHVQFDQGRTGVPVTVWNAEAARLGFLNYEAALALAHWFLASDGVLGGLCLEARLVEIDFIYKYETKERGVGPSISQLEMQRATKWEPREVSE